MSEEIAAPEAPMESWRTEQTKNAFGGTELMRIGLGKMLGEDFLKGFQIVLSRPVELDMSKHRILWCHDLAHDQSNLHLQKGGWRKYHGIVFVSNFQKEQYFAQWGIQPSRTVVLQNAIRPLEPKEKPTDRFNIVYHTTPHRGLHILVNAFNELYKKWGNKIHLDVFSSFGVYGWQERDAEFKAIFEAMDKAPGITSHGAQKNEVIRQHLESTAHCFAYPSIWPETSCLSLMEAMSAGLICIHPNLAALPETAANWTVQYNWHEDHNVHAMIMAERLDRTIENFFDGDPIGLKVRTENQAAYANIFYGWDGRAVQWKQFLSSVKEMPVTLNDSPMMHFSTDNPNVFSVS